MSKGDIILLEKIQELRDELDEIVASENIDEKIENLLENLKELNCCIEERKIAN